MNTRAAVLVRTVWVAVAVVVAGMLAPALSAPYASAITRAAGSPPAPSQLLTPPPAPIVGGADAGYLPDGWNVTPDGSFTTGIPLDVPEGRAGMAPRLSLSYSSNAANGLLGVGWSVTGASSRITRCGKSIATEGTVSGIAYDTSDRYCLDGKKLIETGTVDYGTGGYGGIDTQYRTETNDFTQIISTGSSATIAGGPDKFIARTKGGQILTFEPQTTTRARSGVGFAPIPVELTDNVTTPRVVWLLTKQADRSGNEIRYSYTGDFANGDYRPDRITYTFHTGLLQGKRYVQFTYEERPDDHLAYEAGASYTLYTRLKSIGMYAPNPATTSLVWRYDLGYVTSASTSRSLLASVTKCGAQGGCLVARHFDWDNPGSMPTFVETPITTQAVTDPSAARPPGLRVLDLNGDGSDDAIYELGGTSDLNNPVRARLGQRLGATVQPLIQAFTVTGNGMPADTSVASSRPLDLDADGRAEFDAKSKVGTSWKDTLLKWDAAQQRMVDTGLAIDSASNTDFGDMNGDGRLDLLTNAALAFNTGGAFGPTTQLTQATGCSRRSGDVDGDGRSDLVGLELMGTTTCGTKSYVIRVGDAGQITKTSTTFTDSGVEYYRVFPPKINGYVTKLGDFNGDGLVDTLLVPTDPAQNARLIWNTGIGLDLHYSTVVVPRDQFADLRIADANNDGRDDVVSFHSNTTLLLSRGDGSFSQGIISSGSGTVVPSLGRTTSQLGDFNGDGRIDVIRIVGQTMSVLVQTSTTAVDHLIKIRDAGAPWPREIVTYSTAWTDHPEKMGDNTCTYPLVCHRAGMTVVRRVDSMVHNVDVMPANATKRTLEYSYEDPVTDLRGRGFLGFGTFRVWDPQRPQETVTQYDHRIAEGTAYALAGRPRTVLTTVPILTATQQAAKPAAGTARVTRRDFTYQVRELDGTHFVVPQATTEKEWEQAVTITWGAILPDLFGPTEHIAGEVTPATPLREVVTQYVADDYGNINQESRATTGGVSHVVNTQYENRVDDWLIGLPASRSETASEPGDDPPAVTRLSEFHYDSAGRLDTLWLERGNPDASATERTTYTYDTYGNQRTATVSAADRPDRKTHIEYDSMFPGQPDEEIYPSQTWLEFEVAAFRPSQWAVVHPAYGVAVATEDVNGAISTAQYDDLGRQVRSNAAGQPETTRFYSSRIDPAGGGINGLVIEVGADQKVTKTFTDAMGRTIASQFSGFDGVLSTVTTKYDFFGRVASKSRPYRIGAQPVSTAYQYDSLDRLLVTNLPDGESTSSVHSYFQTQSFDAAGSETRAIADVDGRVTSRVQMLVRPGGITPVTTSYDYAPFGLPAKVVDGPGNTRTFQYDVRGRRINVTEPDRGTTTTTYYGTGEVRSENRVGAGSTTYGYDSLGRRTSMVGPDGTTTFGWDTSANGIGRMALAVSPDGIRTDFRYDSAGRDAGLDYTDQSDGRVYRLDREYTSTGRLDGLSFPDPDNAGKLRLGYQYNAHGSLRGITRSINSETPLPVWNVQQRNPDLTLSSATLGADGDIDAHQDFDPVTGRLAGISTTFGAQELLDLDFSYTRSGLLETRSQQDTNASRTEEFSYDSLDRMTGWELAPAGTPSTDTNYQYDIVGNLNAISRNGALIDERSFGGAGGARPHALTGRDATSAGGPLETYSYDARGRLTETRAEDDSVVRSTTYTSFDLPRSVTKGGQTWTFAYDAFGNRVKKTGPDGTTFHVPGAYQRQVDGGGVSYTFDVTGPDGPIAQVRSRGGTTAVDYQLTDQLGSIAAVVSEDGEVRQSFFYDPFGVRIDSDGSPFSGDAGATTRGFTGHEHDDETELINMKGRMYDPQLQRFLTPDPVVGDPMDSQNWNPYSYVLNSPMNYTDPSGYTAIDGNCETSPYMPECGGSGNLSGWSGGTTGYGGDSFNSHLGDADGGWGARNFQRDMAEFYGAAEAYGQGGVNGLAAYSRGNLARAMKGTQAEWGPGGYMAKAGALQAAKSDHEGFRPAAASTSSEKVLDWEEGKEILSDLEAAQRYDAVQSSCGDPHGLGDSGLFVQVCSHRNGDTSWSELIWYNDGLDTAYLGEIMMFDLGNGDDRFVESNCSAGAVESGASGSCFTGFGSPKSMHFGEVTYWSPLREEWVHGSAGPTRDPGGTRPRNAWW